MYKHCMVVLIGDRKARKQLKGRRAQFREATLLINLQGMVWSH